MKKSIIAILVVILIIIAGSTIYNRDTEESESQTSVDEFFSQEVGENTPLVKESEIVELKDGDTYEMIASVVKQEVGNRIVKRLAYNQQIPGPVLKVEKDAEITLKFTNNLDVDTTLHSHGLRLDNKFDGVPDVTQAPIKIGESFTYKLKFPDEGIYWYHPHIREDYTQELGLYGNFLVTPTDREYWSEVDREEFLILDDILEGEKFRQDVVTQTLMGRFGDQILINDKVDYVLPVKQGEIARLYITNVANTRTFDFEIPGIEMKLVGGDTGRIENEVIIDNQIIAPSERYVVEILFEKTGTYPIEHRGQKIGNIVVSPGSVVNEKKTLFKTLRNNFSDYKSIRDNIISLVAQAPDKKLRLDIDMGVQMHEMMMNSDGDMIQMDDDDAMIDHCKMMPEMPGCEQYTDSGMQNMDMGTMNDHEKEGDDGIEWEDHMPMMNQMSTDENITWKLIDEETGKENMDINWKFKEGNLVKVSIYNDPETMHPMQHPIHFHGQRFVVLAEEGVANNNLQWKDTVLVPKGKTIEVLVEMSNPGTWMAHCHIAEHLHAGMMMSFEVK